MGEHGSGTGNGCRFGTPAVLRCGLRSSNNMEKRLQQLRSLHGSSRYLRRQFVNQAIVPTLHWLQAHKTAASEACWTPAGTEASRSWGVWPEFSSPATDCCNTSTCCRSSTLGHSAALECLLACIAFYAEADACNSSCGLCEYAVAGLAVGECCRLRVQRQSAPQISVRWASTAIERLSCLLSCILLSRHLKPSCPVLHLQKYKAVCCRLSSGA